MKHRWMTLVVAILFVSTATAANDEPTTLAEVLRSTRAYSPLVHAAAAQVREREADITRAQGAFDHRLEAGINSRLSGYYGGTAATATVTRPLKAMNAEAFASYRLGDGAFPVYDGGALTGTLGEARIGVALSLLRDREIDDRRYALARAEVEAQSQRHAFRAQLVSLQQQAYVAYTRWLIAQRLLETYRELLAVAEQRGQALQRRVDRGDVAAFLLAENEQAILQRKALVVDATRQAGVAAETLSLYLRDADGR
ncbi:MAG: TolC family protein, partial [Rhodoferax sp.]|nr:TolC family protein [Rhodoferax sp.]